MRKRWKRISGKGTSQYPLAAIMLLLLPAATPQTATTPALMEAGPPSTWTTLLALTAAALGVVSALMILRNERWKKKYVAAEEKSTALSKRLDVLTKFAETVYTNAYVDTSFIFLGPRDHGKSSIVTAMTKQWLSIEDIRPTPVDFLKTYWELPAYKKEPLFDEELGITRVKHRHNRIVIYDYAGEDQSINSALDLVKSSERSVIFFVLSAEGTPRTESSAYFNLNTVRKMRRSLKDSSSENCSAYILYSKEDLSSFSDKQDPSNIPQDLINKHLHAVENITAIFGDVPCFLVSGETGYGISYCLRVILNEVFSMSGGAPE